MIYSYEYAGIDYLVYFLPYRHGTKFRANTRSWHAQWDLTIIMAVHNNNDILMVHYEDLPDGDKDVIDKAIEGFQNKCLLSYTKTCHNWAYNNIANSADLKKKFHTYFYTGAGEKKITDLTTIR